ncbi:MAG: hypothetical protein RL711_1305 [Bacteroidota bacterium]
MKVKFYVCMAFVFMFALTSNAQIKRNRITYGDENADNKDTAKKYDSSNEIIYQDKLDYKFYLNTNLGYNLPLGGSSEITQTASSFSLNSLSYGKGGDIAAGLGFYFNKYIAVEFNLGKQYGASQSFNSSDQYTDTVNGLAQQVTIRANTAYSADILKINPNIVLRYPGKFISPYMKFGTIIGLSTRQEIQNYDHQLYGNFIWTYKDISGSGIGLTSSIGVEKMVYQGLGFLFVEMNYVALNQTYESGSMTSATLDGTNILGGYSVASKEYIYVDTIDKNYTITNTNVPRQELKKLFNCNSIGFKFGVKFIIN